MLKKLFRLGALAGVSLAALSVPASADPISVALVTAIGFTAGTTAFSVAVAVANAVIGGILSFGGSLLTQALTKKPQGLKGSTKQVQIGTDVPRNIIFGRGLTAGHIIYVKCKGQKNGTAHVIYRLSDWNSDSLEYVWINGVRKTLTVTTTAGGSDITYNVNDVSGLIKIRFFRGTTTQTADTVVTSDSGDSSGFGIGDWTANHRLAGICYASCTYTYDTDELPSIPDVQFQLKGARLYDWRKDSTNGGSGAHRWNDVSTWEWSDNPAVCEYNFRRGLYRGAYRVLGMGLPASDLMHDLYTAAANICDETLTEGGTTEKRYVCSVIVNDDAEYRVACDAFRTAMAGDVVERAGMFGVLAGASRATVMTITDDDLISEESCTFSRKSSRSDLYNSVSCTFIDPENNWEQSSLSILTNSTWETEDNGERLTRELELGFVPKPYQARRIAAIVHEQSRMQAMSSGRFPSKYRALEPGDWVVRDFNRMGWGTYTMKVVSIKKAAPGQYDIALQQCAAANFTAPSGTITLPAAPVINPGTFGPGVPSSLALSQAASVQTDGSTVITITATWVAGVNARSYIVGIKEGAATEVEYAAGASTAYQFRARAGVSYDVRVRSLDEEGTRSAFTSVVSITAAGDAVAPGPHTALTATGSYRSIWLQWTNPTDADFDVTEIWEASVNNRASATKIAEGRATAFVRQNLTPATTLYYWVRAKDRSGNVSAYYPAGATAGVAGTATSVSNGDVIGNIEALNTLPGSGNWEGRSVLKLPEEELYVWQSGAWNAVQPLIAASRIVAASLSAISANIGTVIAGIIRSGVNGLLFDLDNNLLKSGNYAEAADGTPTAGFKLDGVSNSIKARGGEFWDLKSYGLDITKRPAKSLAGFFVNGLMVDDFGGPLPATVAVGFQTVSYTMSTFLPTWSRSPFGFKMSAQFQASGVYKVAIDQWHPLIEGQLVPERITLSSAGDDDLIVFKSDGSIVYEAYNGSGTLTTTYGLATAYAGMKWIWDLEKDPYNRQGLSKIYGGLGCMRRFFPWVIPAGTTKLSFKLWGAGGGHSQNASGVWGGPGGYTYAEFNVGDNYGLKVGDILWFVVGEGGRRSGPNIGLGFGGRGGGESVRPTGGGLTGVFLGSIAPENALAIAGGGGAGHDAGVGSPGGHATWAGGQTGSGMAVMTGVPWESPSGRMMAAGGGGKVGGMHLVNDPAGGTTKTGGRGGTSYVNTAFSGYVTSTMSAQTANTYGDATSKNPPNNTDADYLAAKTCWRTPMSVGEGMNTSATVAGSAGNGLAVIIIN